MLTESKHVRQNPGEDRRRWFSDRDFDLIVWQNTSGEVTSFQLCYDKRAAEHALTWRPDRPLEHFLVDGGEPGPRQNLAPMMSDAVLPDLNRIVAEFETASAEIDPAIRQQVLDALQPTQPTPITILGEEVPNGVYLLRIWLATPTEMAFGRFRNGEPIALAAGEYLYIGSAHGRRGAATLANRLLRHTGRSVGSPHHIQGQLHNALTAAGLHGKRPDHKSLRWHIDYLLELPGTQITSILAMRTPDRLEKAIVEHLEANKILHPVAPGLGASDHPGHSHLFHVQGGEDWWDKLIENVSS